MDETALYSEFFNAQPQGLLWARPVFDNQGPVPVDFEYAYCNEEASKIFRLTPQEVQGRRLSEVPGLTAENKATILDQMTRVYLTGEKATFTMFNPIVRRFFKVLRTRVQGGVLNIQQDITHENHIIEELDHQRALTDSILDASPNGIIVAEAVRDEQGNVSDFLIRRTNPTFTRLFSLPQDQVLQKSLRQVFPAALGSAAFDLHYRVFQTGKTESTEVHFQGRQPDTWLQISTVKLEEGILVTFTDYTPVKQLQLELEQSVRELERSNTSLEDFASAASHDLQEPLRKIHVFSERLKTGLGTASAEENARLLDRLENAALRMKRLIEDLLTYSKVSAAPEGRQKVKLGEVLDDVLHYLEASISQSGARLHIEELPEIKGDPPQLRQLFQNLVGNALKYRRPDVVPEISVRCREVDEGDPLLEALPGSDQPPYYLIEVTDNGIGFEQAEAEKIFHIFQRLHGRSQYEGTGVGLAIVQKVVANHRGAIRAQGRPGKGATFQVLLPA